MATPGSFVAGTALTAAEMNLLAGGAIPGGYVPSTTSQTGITTITDLTGLTKTFTAVAGRRYKITAQCRVVQNTAVGVNELSIRNGAGTVLNRSSKTLSNTVNNHETHYISAIDVPGAGSVTYKASLATTAGTTDTTLGATQPAFILVEDIGT